MSIHKKPVKRIQAQPLWMRRENAEPLSAIKFQMQRLPFDGAKRALRRHKCKEPGRMFVPPGSPSLRLDFKGYSTGRVAPLQSMIETAHIAISVSTSFREDLSEI